MNFRALLGLDTRDIQKASLLLVRQAAILKSQGLHVNHIGARDKEGKNIGDYEVVVKKLEHTPIHHEVPIAVEKQDGAVESTEYYVLLVDKSTDKLLNVMIQMFTDLYSRGMIQVPLSEVVEANQAMQALNKEITKKHHEKGWCEDPNCTYKKKQ